MADRSKAKSITQAAWGFVNDSLLTPLCLIAKPELIAASALLLAVAHRVTECARPCEESQENARGQNHSLDLNRYLTLSSCTNGVSNDNQTVRPWWKTFRVENLESIYEVANTMLDQYSLSACHYIRERVRKLPRFPGPSLLLSPALTPTIEPSLNFDPAVSPTEISNPDESNSNAVDAQKAVATTPTRPPPSDSMDLGTPVDSDKRSPSSLMISPLPEKKQNHHHESS